MPRNRLIALAFALWIPAAASAQTWEYKVQEVDLISKVRVFANDLLLSSDELEATLGPLGEDGWELVTALPRGGTSLLLVFKRPVAGPVVIAAPPVAPVAPAPVTLVAPVAPTEVPEAASEESAPEVEAAP